MQPSRSSIAVVAALVALAAVIPASAACCMPVKAMTMKAMHASMPCCGDRCTMQRTTRNVEPQAVIAPSATAIVLIAASAVSSPLRTPSAAAPVLTLAIPAASPPPLLALRI